jgi:hypothetical protein
MPYQLIELTYDGSSAVNFSPYCNIPLNFYPNGNGTYAIMNPENIDPTTENNTILNIPCTFCFNIPDIMSGFIILASMLFVLVFVKYPT